MDRGFEHQIGALEIECLGTIVSGEDDDRVVGDPDSSKSSIDSPVQLSI